MRRMEGEMTDQASGTAIITPAWSAVLRDLGSAETSGEPSPALAEPLRDAAAFALIAARA